MGTGREGDGSRRKWMGTEKEEVKQWEKKRRALGENGKKTAGKDVCEKWEGKSENWKKKGLRSGS